MTSEKRTVVLNQQLEGSSLVPLRIVGETKGTKTRYRCLCTECNKECTKMLKDLENRRLATACAVCVRKRIVKGSFNRTANSDGSKRDEILRTRGTPT